MHNIVIGCDPNAVQMKNSMIAHLRQNGHFVTDYGSDDVVYANTAELVATAVAHKEYDTGILICGTGIGMSIAANKIRGVYAAQLSDCYSAQRARLSNNANVACFGAFTLGISLALLVVDTFLGYEYVPGTSSEPKVNKIIELDMNK